jgi:uncharacterized protein YggE
MNMTPRRAATAAALALALFAGSACSKSDSSANPTTETTKAGETAETTETTAGDNADVSGLEGRLSIVIQKNRANSTKEEADCLAKEIVKKLEGQNIDIDGLENNSPDAATQEAFVTAMRETMMDSVESGSNPCYQPATN